MWRHLLKFGVPFALVFACSPAEDSYRILDQRRDGDACVTHEHSVRLVPSYVADDITERTVEVSLKFSCGVPVRVDGLVCLTCTDGMVDRDGFHQFRVPNKVAVGAERGVRSVSLKYESADETLQGSLELKVDYQPAPNGC